jgi:hypothetical protein
VIQEKTITGTALKVTSASKSSGGKIKFDNSTPAQGGSDSGGSKSTTKASSAKKKRSDSVERYKDIDS